MRFCTTVGVLVLIAATGCKKSAGSQVQSLENLAAGRTINQNFCAAPKKLAKDPERSLLYNRIVIDDDTAKNVKWASHLVAEATAAMTAIPPDVQRAFLQANGFINIHKSAGHRCAHGSQADLGEPTACVLIAPDPDVNAKQSLDIYLEPDPAVIRHELVRQFGYFVSQVLPRINAAPVRPGAPLTLASDDSEGMKARKNAILAAYLKDLKGSKNFSLPKVASDDEDLQRAVLADYVFAESFDSYFCNTWGAYDKKLALKIKAGDAPLSSIKSLKNSRALMRDLFPNTYIVFGNTMADLGFAAAPSSTSGFGLQDGDAPLETPVEEPVAATPASNDGAGDFSDGGGATGDFSGGDFDGDSADYTGGSFAGGTSANFDFGPTTTPQDVALAAVPAATPTNLAAAEAKAPLDFDALLKKMDQRPTDASGTPSRPSFAELLAAQGDGSGEQNPSTLSGIQPFKTQSTIQCHSRPCETPLGGSFGDSLLSSYRRDAEAHKPAELKALEAQVSQAPATTPQYAGVSIEKHSYIPRNFENDPNQPYGTEMDGPEGKKNYFSAPVPGELAAGDNRSAGEDGTSRVNMTAQFNPSGVCTATSASCDSSHRKTSWTGGMAGWSDDAVKTANLNVLKNSGKGTQNVALEGQASYPYSSVAPTVTNSLDVKSDRLPDGSVRYNVTSGRENYPATEDQIKVKDKDGNTHVYQLNQWDLPKGSSPTALGVPVVYDYGIQAHQHQQVIVRPNGDVYNASTGKKLTPVRTDKAGGGGASGSWLQ